MPTVPVSNPTPMRSEPLPSARLTAAPSGESPIGQGLQALAGDMHSVFLEQRRKVQSSMWQDASTQLAQDQLHQEFDPQTGWRTKRGKDSFGLHESVLPDFDKSVSKIAQDIPDPEVRDHFIRRSRDQRVDLEQRLDGWIDQQHQQYAGEVLDSTLQTSQAAAALNWQDPARAQREISNQVQALRDYAEANGHPPEWAQAKIADAASATHSAVIGQMMNNGQDLAAKAYFDRVKPELNAQAQQHLGAAVEYGSTQTAAQAAAGRIYSPVKTLEDMDQEADKIPDQKIQAATKERIAALHSTHLQAVDEQGRNLLRDGLRVLNTDPRGLDAIPRDQLAMLNQTDPQRYQALVETAQRMSRREDVTTEAGNAYFIKVRSALSGVEGDARRDLAAKEDLNKLAPLLSKTDLRELADLQDKAKTGKDTTGEHTEEQIAAVTLALNGLKPEPLNHDGTANLEAVAFRTWLRKQVAADKAAGKKLTAEDVQRTANRGFVPLLTGHAWGGLSDIMTPTFMLGVDRKVPASAVGGGKASPAYAQTLGEFSDEQVKAAREQLRAKGLAPDADTVLSLLAGQTASGMVKPGTPAAPPVDLEIPLAPGD